ncbi:MAG: hypothetical protein HETSPECPRED_003949 [Heterodermia speciosa]|uniref:Glycosyltransferase family 69 protein n=1 Tax=Heterodermia speciosa TaxID=116794 RepID=A0A8H3FAJ2_9LECA|nr:MAG: hypothetical protein HETSPECPRED_003949 [Heterodermia speciosa]
MIRRKSRLIRYVLFSAFALILLDLLLSYRLTYPRLERTRRGQELTGVKSVYLASSQWNSGKLLEQHWIPSLLQLISDLGAAKVSVFVSIYENGSWDSTKSVLQQLRQTLERLGVQHSVNIDDTSHEQIVARNASSSGWLNTAYGKEMRRIPYLASIRNEALRPLSTLSESGAKFDKILYINDVVFSSTDALTLLNTRKGDYAAACGLDFLNPPWNWVDRKIRGNHPPGMYDDFATRDSNGGTLGSHLYPYFSSRLSKTAIMAGREVPVQSCWNGMVAFDAAPFQSAENPLRFRGIPDSLAQTHVEASECCLIHYDNPLSSKHGVWINPSVRVAYSSTAYQAVSDGLKPQWPTKSELHFGAWKTRWFWWLRDPGSPSKTWYRVRQWQRHNPNAFEPGLACASDLAMVLTSNGWAMRGARFE